jgi:hypothetical protein
LTGRFAGFALLFISSTVIAATRLADLAVKPNPAVSQVEIVVTVDRGQFDKQSCDVFVTPEEGAQPLRLAFMIGDRVKSVSYTYKKNGTYAAKAVSGSGCTGTRSVNVVVGAAEPAPASKAQATGCPAGWYLVPESVQGGRYSCRPNLPAQALKCEGGTTYFAEGGVIGCR